MTGIGYDHIARIDVRGGDAEILQRKRDNFAAVPDNKRLPPTTTPGSTWKPIKTTPDSNR